MHYYEDERLIDESILRIVIYKHIVGETKTFEIEVTSVQECKYFPPYELCEILKTPNVLDNDKIKSERWTLLTIRCTQSTWKINMIEDVSLKTKDPFLKLH